MKATPLIYSRTYDCDYRVIVQPDYTQCPEIIQNEFIQFARQVINTDKFKEIENLRWAIMKEGNFILWGCGIYNKWVNTSYSHDFTNERIIRGFYGIVIHCNQEIVLPFSNNFLGSLINDYIVPFWKVNHDKRLFEKERIIESYSEENITILSKTSITLNEDVYKSKIFPHDKKLVRDLFSLALSPEIKEIKLATGLNSTKHAQYACLSNATVLNEKEISIIENNLNNSQNSKNGRIKSSNKKTYKPNKPSTSVYGKIISTFFGRESRKSNVEKTSLQTHPYGLSKTNETLKEPQNKKQQVFTPYGLKPETNTTQPEDNQTSYSDNSKDIQEKSKLKLDYIKHSSIENNPESNKQFLNFVDEIICIRDNLKMKMITLNELKESENSKAFDIIKLVQQETEGILKRMGISVINEEGKFNDQIQKIIKTKPAIDKTLHDTIAQTVREGYRMNDIIIRFQEVILYSYNQ